MQTIFESNTALADTDAVPSPVARPALVEVKCYHLASVQGPRGSRHHVIVDPTPSTVAAVYAWRDAGTERGIRVTDRAGLFERETPSRVIDTIYSYGTLVVTTDR